MFVCLCAAICMGPVHVESEIRLTGGQIPIKQEEVEKKCIICKWKQNIASVLYKLILVTRKIVNHSIKQNRQNEIKTVRNEWNGIASSVYC